MGHQDRARRKSLQILVAVCIFALSACAPALSGKVVADGTPVPDAIVRIQGSDISTITDDLGNFRLSGMDPKSPVYITAWARGYFNVRSTTPISPGSKPLTLELISHSTFDNTSYIWVSAYSKSGSDMSCENCHSNPESTFPSLPFDEWRQDAHSSTVTNRRFLTMYYGTDVNGNQSPPTRKGYSRDYGSFPLLPDRSLPYYGPGYKLDFPDSAGNCAACHAPAAAVNSAYGVDPSTLTGAEAEGVTCDFCHKIWDVKLSPSGLPEERMPGVLSFELRRPEKDHQFFAGPFDDVAPGEDTYSELQRESLICAPCHHGVFWGTVIYNSYGEWLESPYSDPSTGKTCQECHMLTGSTSYFARSDSGGLGRDPDTINSHLMPGASSRELLENAVAMDVSAERQGASVRVDVALTNSNCGHHVPTGSPLRQLILVLEATNSSGSRLQQLGGPTIPEWGGSVTPTGEGYAGLPGVIYAKILQERWTQAYPSGSYWNPTRILTDNRIPAYETDRTTFLFEAPGDGEIAIEVRLIFRRAFAELMEQKGWEVADIEMEQELIVIN